MSVCALGLLALVPLLTYGCDWVSTSGVGAGGNPLESAFTGEQAISTYFQIYAAILIEEVDFAAVRVGPVLLGYFLLGLLFALARRPAVRALTGLLLLPFSMSLTLVSGFSLLSAQIDGTASPWLWLFFLSVVTWIVILSTRLVGFIARQVQRV